MSERITKTQLLIGYMRADNWPPCPEHPHTHPLAAVVREGDAVWMCPATEAVVSEIGRLPEPSRRDRAR